MDTYYILDSAFECGELTPVEYAVLRSPVGAFSLIDHLVERDELEMSPDYLSNTARAFLERLPLAQRIFFGAQALEVAPMALRFLKQRASLFVQLKVQQDLGVTQALKIPELYPELMRVSDTLMVTQEAEVGEGPVRMMLERMFPAVQYRWSQDITLMQQALSCMPGNTELAPSGQVKHDQALCDVALEVQPLLARLTRSRLAYERKLARQERTRMSHAKAAIKKATKLFLSLGKEQNLKLLVSGGEVCLSHPDSPFKFIVQPVNAQGWLLERTAEPAHHTPYELSLFTKEDVFLAKLCVYFTDTPVLDQLLSLSLFIESGNEVQLLETANWFATQDWTAQKSQTVLLAYPSLSLKVPQLKEGPAEVSRSALVREIRQTRQEQHWEPFRGRVEQWVNTWMLPVNRAVSELPSQVANAVAQLTATQLQVPPAPLESAGAFAVGTA